MPGKARCIGSNQKVWFVELNSSRPKDEDAIIVFAFACAGGSVWDFRALDALMPSSCYIVGMELPGHMMRVDEPFEECIEDIGMEAADGITYYIRWQKRKPRAIALLGHSMGGTVAYETAMRLEVSAWVYKIPKPSCVFVCACDAPHQHINEESIRKWKLLAAAPTAKEFVKLQEEEFHESRLKELYEIDPEGAETFVNIMRDDIRLISRYDKVKDRKLFMPIMPLFGSDDGLTAEYLSEWSKYTLEPLRTPQEFPGGHHFIKTSTKLHDIARCIVANATPTSREG